MYADRRIGRPWPARDERHTRPMRQRAIGARHEPDAAFLPAGHHIDRRHVDQSIQHGKKALARHGEDTVAALRDKLVDQNPAAGTGGCLHVGHV